MNIGVPNEIAVEERKDHVNARGRVLSEQTQMFPLPRRSYKRRIDGWRFFEAWQQK